MSLSIDQRSMRSAGHGRVGLASAGSDCVNDFLHSATADAIGHSRVGGFAPVAIGETASHAYSGPEVSFGDLPIRKGAKVDRAEAARAIVVRRTEWPVALNPSVAAARVNSALGSSGITNAIGSSLDVPAGLPSMAPVCSR